MKVRCLNLFGVVLFLLLFIGFSAYPEEEKTISVYYPSPYGEYNELRANRIAVGDNVLTGYPRAGDWDGAGQNIDLYVENQIVVGRGGISTQNRGIGINKVPEFPIDVVGRGFNASRFVAGWAFTGSGFGPFQNTVAGWAAGNTDFSEYVATYYDPGAGKGVVASNGSFLLASRGGQDNQVNLSLGGDIFSGNVGAGSHLNNIDGMLIYYGKNGGWDHSAGWGGIGFKGGNAIVAIAGTNNSFGCMALDGSDFNIQYAGDSGALRLSVATGTNSSLTGLKLERDGSLELGDSTNTNIADLSIYNNVIIGQAGGGDNSRDLTVYGKVEIGEESSSEATTSIYGNLTVGSKTAPIMMTVNGNLGIGSSEKPGYLVVLGDVKVGNDGDHRNVSINGSTTISDVLTVSNIDGADVAEYYLMEDSAEPGDVMEIDLENDERLVKTQRPYSTLIAGVVSETPGIVIAAEKRRGYKPIALKGRVPCNVTNEGGPIHRGDLLVSSSTPGYAMKADAKKITIATQIIGIALADFDGEKGKVKVFVK